ncbi:nucleotide disphospho-sugar-binding domain-containing protein [Verrucosispora sp. WMMD573]|uniref:glycosyltransferase n=1 Tax=Verrucosispora sp. WMMD573 TaxID=3015149 RepID=UPI00248C7172|nr:nucleotide disphospho-sugar-binding domain-containing protein [Verrucosispora sp. WMMD573]WBB53730.1 hypothetical protein O7601_24700 [Verrucosispora sp. WMMD573]
MRVLIVTHGTDGDVLPFLSLAGTMVERRHQATVLTHQRYGPAVTAAGAEFIPIDDADSEQSLLAATPRLLCLRGPADLRDFYQDCGLWEQLSLETEALTAAVEPGRTVLVGRHTSALSVLLAAELTDVPAVWLALSPIQYMTWPMASYNYRAGLGDGLRQVRHEVGLPVDGEALFRPPDLDLAGWPDWFDRAGESVPTGVHCCGFLNGDRYRFAPAGRTAAPARPSVLVTGGTGRMLQDDFYAVTVAGAMATGHPVTVVTPFADLLGPAERGRVTWLPGANYHELFTRSLAVIHHGGIGTLARCVELGIPQVIVSAGGDRSDNGARAAVRGVGEWVDFRDWSPANVAAALERAVRRPPRNPAPAAAGEAARRATEHIERFAADWWARRPVTDGRAR